MPNTAIFQPDLFQFLCQLKRQNNRDWFAKNKARYQQVVVEPAMLFINSFAPHLAKLSPHFVADARPTRGSLFRIYQDTRFSSDKIPYKTHTSGFASRTRAARTPTRPCSSCIWSRTAASRQREFGTQNTPALTKIRTAIVAQPEQWKKLTRKLNSRARA